MHRFTRSRSRSQSTKINSSPSHSHEEPKLIPAKVNLSHEERTASEPRATGLQRIILDEVTTVNDTIRTFRFVIPNPTGINFLPGQWLDVYVPGIAKAGGFTITSSPRDAVPSYSDSASKLFLELAVQKSPNNPPAAWLWQPVNSIRGKELQVRVGGNFVWPPPGVNMGGISRAVFIAGGVGINPLVSMLSVILKEDPSLDVCLMYSTKLPRIPSRSAKPSEVLFLPRILELFGSAHARHGRRNYSRIELFFTSSGEGEMDDEEEYPNFDEILESLGAPDLPVVISPNRMAALDVSINVGTKDEQRKSVFYVCGPPDMTDEITKFLGRQHDVDKARVLCEKWW
ncbi:hypothetical protein K504DRAFT_391407 [Pleomassaria siparia CBS 279.74]|uniref:FAD-binding FR-type domain-containing protein n=1 Tax=Pleomassaria siparia CBS 279.74 TaxID=1314801 RepID=A0A6G1JTP1_9PLEO|nr:hypothetical protein K504DRAFT_391407 [Pleomassaria siparia CBS 279.74]